MVDDQARVWADEIIDKLGPQAPVKLVRKIVDEVEPAMRAQDAWDRMLELTAMLEALNTTVEFLARQRDQAVQELRLGGASLEAIAKRSGLSKTRIHQLSTRPEQPSPGHVDGRSEPD